MYKAATALSTLMKVYTIPCHDRGHINVMFVLQSCTDTLHILPSPSSETFPSSSDGACNLNNTEVEEDGDVIEEVFIAINKEADKGIKQEEIPEDITFPDIKPEPDEVRFYETHFTTIQKYNFSCDVSISGQFKQIHCRE
jgi:hypothetical protein